MVSKELTNPVFTDIAFGASHTNSHWRTIPPATSDAREGASSRGRASKNPKLQGEKLVFIIIFS